MARDGSGNYSIPNTFTPATTIASAAVNANFSDIATAMTNSLARNSEGPMTAALVLHQNGFNYEVDPDTGIKRTGANEQALFCGGANVVVVGTATISIAIAINVVGALAAASGAFSGAGSFGNTLTITNSSAGFVAEEHISTDAGAAAGPIFKMYRNSASPAASDVLAQLEWHGQDSGANKTRYAYQTVIVTDPTNGSEDADWYLVTVVAGVETTIIRSSATQIQIPGSLAVTGAITGAGITASAALSGATAAGAMLATQAEQEAGTATDKLVTPGRQHLHPAESKCWARANGAASTVDASYNLTSITDNGSGDLTFNIGTDFSSANYGFSTGAYWGLGGGPRGATNADTSLPAAGTIRIRQCDSTNGTVGDQGLTCVTTFGDQ